MEKIKHFPAAKSYIFLARSRQKILLFKTVFTSCRYDVPFSGYRRSKGTLIFAVAVLVARSHLSPSLCSSFSLARSFADLPRVRWSVTAAESALFYYRLVARNVRISRKKSGSRRFREFRPPFTILGAFHAIFERPYLENRSKYGDETKWSLQGTLPSIFWSALHEIFSNILSVTRIRWSVYLFLQYFVDVIFL